MQDYIIYTSDGKMAVKRRLSETWRKPGDLIPQGAKPDPHEALLRNALAHEQWQQEEQRKRVAERRAA